MKKWHYVVGLLAGLATSQTVDAQINPSNRPAFSPYLNLNRSGSSPAINYYGIVRPQNTFANSLQQLQQQGTALALQQSELASPTSLPPTGHRSGFMTQSKYFMNLGTGRTGVGAVGGKAPAAAQAKAGGR